MSLPAIAAAVLLATAPASPSLATTPAASRLELTSLQPPPSTERTGGQLALQIGLGAATGGLVGFAGYWGGAFASFAVCRSISTPCLIAGVVTGGALGVAVGAPMGVWLASSLTGYQGSVGNSFLFAAIGAVPPILMSLFPLFQDGTGAGLTIALGGLLPLAGAVIGHGVGGSSPGAQVAWMPAFVPRPGGGTLAVVGVL